MSRRGLSSRKPADYDNEVHGRSETNSPPGDYTLNTGLVPVNLFRPKYEEGPMIFRPFPMLDYEKPQTMLQPSRKSPNPGGYTHWIVRVAAVSYVGSVEKKQVTFLLHHPNDKDGKQNNPYRTLYYAAKAAHDSGKFSSNRRWDSEWNRLIMGKKGSGAPLDRPSYLYFTQGAMLQNGEKVFMGDRRTLPFGLAKGDDLCVQQLKSSAGRALYALLDLERKSYDGDPEQDPGLPFKYGDPTGFFSAKKRKIEAGNFIMIFNPKVTKVEGITGRSIQAGDNDDMGKGYDVQLLNEISLNKKLYLPDIDSAGVDQIFEKVCFWFDDEASGDRGLLNIAPPAQQCLWIAQAFQNVPKLIQYAWQDNPEFFTDEVNGVLRNRAQGSVPGDDEDEDDRRGSRRRDDDDDDDDRRGSRNRRRDDDDDDRRGGGRSRRGDDEDDDKPARRRDPTQGRDDDDDKPARRRPADDEDDDDAPPSSRRRPSDEDDDDKPSRSRPKDDDDDDKPARRRPKDENDDDDVPRRRPKDDDDDKPARRPKDDEDDDKPARRGKADEDDAPRRRPKDDDRDDDYFDEDKKESKGGKDEFAEDERRGKKDDDLDKSSAAAKTAKGNGGKRNEAPPKDAPAPKSGGKKETEKKPAGRSRGK